MSTQTENPSKTGQKVVAMPGKAVATQAEASRIWTRSFNARVVSINAHREPNEESRVQHILNLGTYNGDTINTGRSNFGGKNKRTKNVYLTTDDQEFALGDNVVVEIRVFKRA